MPESAAPNDTPSIYRAALTWLVGLSAAAVAGAFLNFDKVASAPIQVRLLFFVAAAAFGLTTCFGVQYFFWLNHISNRIEKRTAVRTLREAEQAHATDATKTTDEKKAAAGKAEKHLDAETELTGVIDKAWTQIGKWHKKTLLAFDVSMVLAGLLLLAGAIAGTPCPKCPPTIEKQQGAAVPPSPPYDIVKSAVHTTRHGKEAHTFLVNKDSGEVWQMLCHKNDDQVEFHKIHRYGFDGKPDDFSAVPRITLGPQTGSPATEKK